MRYLTIIKGMKKEFFIATLVSLQLGLLGFSLPAKGESTFGDAQFNGRTLAAGRYYQIWDSVGFSLACSAQYLTKVPFFDYAVIRDYGCRIESDELKALNIKPDRTIMVPLKSIGFKPSWLSVVDEQGKEIHY